MKLRHLWSWAVCAALVGPAFAQEEEFPDAPKPAEGEELPDSDEEEMEEEDIDVLGTLESIIGKMKDAEASLAKLPEWKATDLQGKAVEDMEKFLKAKDLQEKAIREMSKIFDGSSENQKGAIEDIEKLIKAAKEGQGNQQGQQQQKQDNQQQPKDQQQNKSSNPATKPYTPPPTDSTGRNSRSGDLSGKWGDLPDRLRDELAQAEDEFKSLRGAYADKLREYWRVLGALE